MLRSVARLRRGSAAARPLLRHAAPALAVAPRLLSTAKPRKSMAIPEGSAYAILGVSRDVNKDTLQAVYKSLVRART